MVGLRCSIAPRLPGPLRPAVGRLRQCPDAGRGTRQRARRMAGLGRRPVEHPLLSARPDQCGQLQRFEAGVAVERRPLRQRRVLPHHAALRQRPAVHGGHHPPGRDGARSRHRRDALDVAAGRRHPLAEGAPPVRRPRAGVLDRREGGTGHRGHSRLSPGLARRQDRHPRSPVRPERHRGSDGRTGPAAGAARGGRLRPAHHQRRRPGPEGPARRNLGSQDPDRRRRHHRHRSGARRDRQQLAGHRGERRDRGGQLRGPRLLPDPAAQPPRLHPRIRRAHRQAALEIQPDSPAGGVRRRHLEERHEDRHRGGGEERRVGHLLRRSGAGPGVHPGRDAADGRIRRPPAGEQPVRQQPGGDRREDRQAALALPVRAPRHLGLRQPDGAQPARRDGGREAAQGGGADHQAGLRVRARPRHRGADLAHRRDAGAPERRARASRPGPPSRFPASRRPTPSRGSRSRT